MVYIITNRLAETKRIAKGLGISLSNVCTISRQSQLRGIRPKTSTYVILGRGAYKLEELNEILQLVRYAKLSVMQVL